jgi:SAM-dependent methyltransferase
MHQDYTGKDTLEFLKDAVNYNRFLERELLRFITPHNTAVDLGAGNGEFAHRLSAHGIAVTAIEQDASLREQIAALGIPVIENIQSAKQHARIYSLNVLEHIEDDDEALRLLYATLEPSGSLFLYVPAFNCLYTPLDSTLGHFRRYRKKALMDKLTRNGFSVLRAEYVDVLGFFGWLAMSKVPGDKTRINHRMVRFYDQRLFGLSRLCDRVAKPFFGKNLLVIARKDN